MAAALGGDLMAKVRFRNIIYETRGDLPGATPLCFDTALLYSQFCCQPLLLLEKLKAMSQG